MSLLCINFFTGRFRVFDTKFKVKDNTMFGTIAERILLLNTTRYVKLHFK